MQNYIFDFDGTLADSGETGVVATQKAFADLGLPEPTAADISYYMGIPIEVSFKKMAPGHEFSDAEFEKLLQVFRKYYQELESKMLTLFPGIKEMLAELQTEQKGLYVVSSKHSKTLLRNLKSLGIDAYFTNILGADNVQNFKPAPDGVLQVLELDNLDPDQTVMIGDAIFDLQMGKAAGVHTAAVTWGAHDRDSLAKEQPDYLIEQPADLTKLA
ncbi:HAD family hydrolase [Fructilactobacillus vespulae]|uniref:HAD family hydrolase n=1 Tax=Fructilactobacillus vespulae TaxID=1249630 RepID=UPI0039B6CFCD